MNGPYSVIYADPPWAYRSKRTGGSMTSGAAQQYPVLTTDQVAALDVTSLCAKPAVCFLWATVPMLPDALYVLGRWGFTYKTALVWHKTGRLGLGHWFRGEAELLLLGTLGAYPAFRSSIRNVIAAARTGHSAKPGRFREVIESVTPNARRLELFAREKVEGWDAWGDQVACDVDLEAAV